MTLHPRFGDPWTARLMERQLVQLSEEEKATIVPARPEKLSSGSCLRRTRARQIVFVGY